MPGFDKKSINRVITATTLAELLVIMVIIGIMAVIMMKTFKRDTVAAKYLYHNIMSSVETYAKNALNNSTSGFKWDTGGICNLLASDFNTIGDINCTAPVLAENFITTNGAAFYGLEGGFTTTDPVTGFKFTSPAEHFIIFRVDIDGAEGDNILGSDILVMELRKNATVTPVDAAAKNQDIVAARVVRVFDGTNMVRLPGATESGEIITFTEDGTVRSVLSYDEASCLAFGQATRTIGGTAQNCTTLQILKNESLETKSVDQASNCQAPNICKIIIMKPKLL